MSRQTQNLTQYVYQPHSAAVTVPTVTGSNGRNIDPTIGNKLTSAAFNNASSSTSNNAHPHHHNHHHHYHHHHPGGKASRKADVIGLCSPKRDQSTDHRDEKQMSAIVSPKLDLKISLNNGPKVWYRSVQTDLTLT